MQWDLKLICEALNASFQTVSNMCILEFKDKNFKFNIHIQPEAKIVLLAVDTSEPIISMPLFEYSFNCNIIKVVDSPYFSETKAIYFFENKDSNDEVRLALNLRPDGNWYIWCNTWRNKHIL